MTYEKVDIDALIHSGKLGMKWGQHRAAAQAKSVARGQKIIARNGGSANKAVAKAAGKATLGFVAAKVGSRAIGSIHSDPNTKLGIKVLANLGSAAYSIKQIRDINDISNADDVNNPVQ